MNTEFGFRVIKTFNPWWKAKVVKSDMNNVWYIAYRGNGSSGCFNPLTKSWQNCVTDENGVMVCCFASEELARRCLEKNRGGISNS